MMTPSFYDNDVTNDTIVPPPVPPLATSVPDAFSAVEQKELTIRNRIDRKTKVVEELGISLEEISKELESCLLRMTSLRVEHEEIQSRLTTIKETEHSETQKLSSITKSIEITEDKIRQTKEKIRNVRFEVKDKKDRADRTSRNLKRLRNNLAEKTKRLRELKEERENISTRREQIREERDHYREMISINQTDLKRLRVQESSKASRLAKGIETLSEELSSLKSKQEIKTLELVEMQSKNDAVDEELRDLSSELSFESLERRIEELSVECKDSEMELQDFKGKLSSLEKDRVSSSESLESRVSRVKKLEIFVRQNERRVSETSQKRENLDEEIRELRIKIEEKDVEISNRRKTMHECANVLHRAKAELDRMASKHVLLQNEMKERVSRSRQREEMSKHLKSKVEKMTRENVNLKDELDQLYEEYEHLTQEQNMTQEKSKQLREDVENLRLRLQPSTDLEFQSASSEFNESDIELRRVNQESTLALRKLISESQSRDDVVLDLKSQIRRLNEREKDLVSDRSTQHDDDVERLGIDLRDVTDSISNLRRDMWSEERELKEKVQVLNSLRSEIRVMETKIDARNKELASLFETCPAAEARLTEEVKSMELSLRTLNEKLEVCSFLDVEARSAKTFLSSLSLSLSLYIHIKTHTHTHQTRYNTKQWRKRKRK